MAQDEFCTLPADAAGHVFDRLAGLQKIHRNSYDRSKDRNGIVVRVIRYKLDDPQRATRPANLRSLTPAGVIQELYALSLAHFVIRAAIFDAAKGIAIDPERLSFTGCFQILKCRLPECNTQNANTIQSWYDALLWEMQHELLEPRRNRINPRVIKQKILKWPKKQPKHRPAPKLSKTFANSVVIT